MPTFLKTVSAKTEKRILWAIAALLVMAVIFVFSSQATFASEELSDAVAGLLKMEQQNVQTRVSNQSIFFGLTLRKFAHIFLFAALGFCMYQTLADVKGRIAIAVGVSYIYGALDEVHQTMSGRIGRWQDTLIDLIGIALGIAVALVLPWLNQVCKKWFYEDWDDRHPEAKRRLEWWLDALSLAAVMQYVGYRFLQTTMFPFIYSELYKTATFLSLLLFGGVRFAYRFARKQWAESDEKAQIRRFLQFVGACCLALPFFIVAYKNDFKILMFIPICWMCLYDMRVETVFKWYVRVVGIMLGATVLCCMAGVVKNIGGFDNIGFNQSFGIINTTDFAAYFIFLVLFAWCAQKDCRWYISLALSAFAILIGIYVFRITGSRTALICCILTAIVSIWESITRKIHDKYSFTRALIKTMDTTTVLSFPIFLFITGVLTYLYSLSNPFAVRMNALLSSRLYDTWTICAKYGIHLFGTSLTMHGIGASLIRDWRAYDFMDSSYVYLFIRYGIVLACTFMGLWVWMTIKAIHNGNKKIALSMTVIAAYAFSESHFVDIPYNIMLAMPFCAFAASSQANQSATQPAPGFNIAKAGIHWVSCCSAIVLAGLGYVALPKALSWLGTLFYLRRWNTGTRTLFAFLLCTAILALIYGIWKLVSLVWYKRSKPAIALLTCAIVMLIASAVMGNLEIEKGLAEYTASLDAEGDAVQLVMNSAGQPVYALERAELYQRHFGGIAEGIMTPEDLLHSRSGTILTDRVHELPVIMLYGGQYVELSEDSAAYSFDPAVIEALTAAGYQWKSYYSSERTCDLEDLAEVNSLSIDEKGRLVLNRPRHSLAENRYYDQWTGQYEVRFKVSIDPTATNADLYSSPAAIIAHENAPICTLRVMGYKGEEIILGRKLLASDFNKEGQCTMTLSYSIPDTPRTEYRIYAANGITLYVDEIAWRRVA